MHKITPSCPESRSYVKNPPKLSRNPKLHDNSPRKSLQVVTKTQHTLHFRELAIPTQTHSLSSNPPTPKKPATVPQLLAHSHQYSFQFPSALPHQPSKCRNIHIHRLLIKLCRVTSNAFLSNGCVDL